MDIVRYVWEQIVDFVWFMVHQPKRWWCLNVAGHVWSDVEDHPIMLQRCLRCGMGKGW